MDQFFVIFPWWYERFFVILQKIIIFATTMDNTLLFTYCITDGEIDNMSEKQKSIILRILSERDHIKNETK